MAGTDKVVVAGAHRTVPPDETWAKVSPMLPAMGITRVADVTGLDILAIPVFQAVRPNGRTLAVAQGKGITRDLARISAVMECIETWHAEEASLFSVQVQVAEMAPLLPYSIFDLPRPPRSVLSESTRIDWVVGKPVLGEDPVWLPWACARLDNTTADGWSPPLLSSNSNGLASGNTTEEALLHGLYELLERHARNHVEEFGRSGLELNLSTVTGNSADLLECFTDAEVQVRVHDLTEAAGAACYETFIWSADLPVRFAGWGCHRDADVALCRALTEAAQSRLTMIAGTRDDLPDEAYEWISSRSRLRCPFPPSAPGRAFPGSDGHVVSLNEDLHEISAIVNSQTPCGAFWIDLTRPEFDIPVVKVVAPGLRLVKDYR